LKNIGFKKILQKILHENILMENFKEMNNLKFVFLENNTKVQNIKRKRKKFD